MGDEYFAAIGKSVQYLPSFRKVNVRENRLSHRGMHHLLEHLGTGLTEANFSWNRLGSPAVTRMTSFVQRAESLRYLNLSRNGLTDSCMRRLCTALRAHPSLTRLDLSYNTLRGGAGAALGELLADECPLASLGVGWNSLGGKGMVALAEGLASNTSLTTLDLAFNSLGSSSDSLSAFSAALASNRTLTHLDLSHNGIGAKEADALSKGLASNQTLLGLHVEGNCMALSNLGHMLPRDDTEVGKASAHHLVGEISSILEYPDEQSPRSGSKCWLCERWAATTVEAAFPGVSVKGQVRLHLEMDEWEPTPMEPKPRSMGGSAASKAGAKDQDMFVARRVLRPGPHRFYFSICDELAVQEYDKQAAVVEQQRAKLASAERDLSSLERKAAALAEEEQEYKEAKAEVERARAKAATLRRELDASLDELHGVRPISYMLSPLFPTVLAGAKLSALAGKHRIVGLFRRSRLEQEGGEEFEQCIPLPSDVKLATLNTMHLFPGAIPFRGLGCAPRPPTSVPVLAPEKSWTVDQSVFATRVMDADAQSLFNTAALYARAFAADYVYGKIRSLVRDAEELERVKETLEASYKDIVQIFRHYSTYGGRALFAISESAFMAFCRDAKLTTDGSPEERDRYAHLVLSFVAANVESNSSSQPEEVRAANPDRLLTRCVGGRVGVLLFSRSLPEDSSSWSCLWISRPGCGRPYPTATRSSSSSTTIWSTPRGSTMSHFGDSSCTLRAWTASCVRTTRTSTTCIATSPGSTTRSARSRSCTSASS